MMYKDGFEVEVRLEGEVVGSGVDIREGDTSNYLNIQVTDPTQDGKLVEIWLRPSSAASPVEALF